MTVHEKLAEPIQPDRKRRCYEAAEGEHEKEQSFTEVEMDNLPLYKVLAKFMGPGIMVAIAYIDPGNYTADLQAGSRFKYKLLWSVAVAHVIGYIFQVLTVKQTLATGRTFARECGLEYPWLRAWLWFWGETASVASDVGYVMGTAISFKILFNLNMTYGVLISILDTFLFLLIQNLGHRKMEAFCAILGMVVVSCCVFEISGEGLSFEMLTGLIPLHGGVHDPKDEVHSVGQDEKAYVWNIIAQIGASVVAPNYFLHSALTMTRRVAGHGEGDQANRDRQLRTSVKWSAVETAIGIGFAFIINAILLLLAGSLYYEPGKEAGDSLVDYASMLGSSLGSSSKTIFALSIFAGGMSASVTGTMASQYILEGFYEVKVKAWILRMCTRTISIVPAFLMTLAWGDQSGAIIDACQVVVNFAAPFSLIPLVKMTSSPLKMGVNVNSAGFTAILWILCVVLTGLNLMAIYQEVSDEDSPFFGGVVQAYVVTMVVGLPYAASVVFLMLKPLTVAPDQEKGLVKSA